MSAALPPVDLSNCDREPIHIPGSIQPHGALLAFLPDGALALRSANAGAMLGELPAPGERLDERHLTSLLRAEVGNALRAFARQVDKQIVFYSDDTERLRAGPLNGRFTEEEALRRRAKQA